MKFIQSLLILIISIVAIANAQDKFYIKFSKTAGNPICSAGYNAPDGQCIIPCSNDVSFRVDISQTSSAFNFTSFSDTNCTTMSFREQSSNCYSGSDIISGGGYLYNITCTETPTVTPTQDGGNSTTGKPDHHGSTAPIVVASLSTLILTIAALLL